MIVDFARRYTPGANVYYHHVDAAVFNDIEVELHFIPSWFTSPTVNTRWLKWQERQFSPQKDGNISVASTEFNLVLILLHIYRHLFQEGIGLRQLIDYFFVLKAASPHELKYAAEVLGDLGLDRFAAGIMYIMNSVFRLDDRYLLCKPDSGEGAFVLSEIMQAGNFGKYDKRISGYDFSVPWKRFVYRVARSIHFITHYPAEVLLLPFWKLWHQAWQKWAY